jgi:hypothetical protein
MSTAPCRQGISEIRSAPQRLKNFVAANFFLLQHSEKVLPRTLEARHIFEQTVCSHFFLYVGSCLAAIHN